MSKGSQKARTANKAANDELIALESLKKLADQLAKEAADTTEKIRKGTVDVVVVFVDMVDSTKFKLEHADAPEKWILRVKQFSDILTAQVTGLGGRVVKYLGDEVMAIFDTDSRIHDAMALVSRLDSIEKVLTQVTGYPTKIKIVVDTGPVYLLQYQGHDELDPQGTPVDRCARIGKLAQAGTVLSVADFVNKAGTAFNWHKLGVSELKGIGETVVYQLGVATVSVAKRIEVDAKEYSELKALLSEMESQAGKLKQKNKELSQQLRDAGDSLQEESASEDADAEWEKVEASLKKIRGLLAVPGVPIQQYARAVFLFFRGDGGEEWNSYEGRTFAETVENDLVVEDHGRYRLAPSNKRNNVILGELRSLESKLHAYEQEYGTRENELFDYSLKNAEFWKEKLGIGVSR